jgi:hypothetical protein
VKSSAHAVTPVASPALRRLSVAIAVVVGSAVVALSAPAAVHDYGRIRSTADRQAAAWSRRQGSDGFFYDYYTGVRSRGYGPVILGYGVLRAGARSGDAELVGDGIRAVNTTLKRPRSKRGVFDFLSFASAYNQARDKVPNDPRYRRVRSRWASYLRGFGPAYAGPSVSGCVYSPQCFSNHEVVDAAGELEAIRTGVRSSDPGTRLYNRSALRADAARIAGVVAPEAMGVTGRSSGPGPRTGLGLLSDTGTYPLAYHALSTAMLGDVLVHLGRRAPARGRSAFRRGAESLVALMAPDGDVAYIGRRQEEPWALAASVYVGETAARMFHGDSAAAGRFKGMARRALRRLTLVHPLPRSGHGVTRDGRGRDLSSVVSDGLTVFLLDRAADQAAHAPAVQRRAITADRSGGWFLDRDQNGFAAVRRGGLWYAVHRRIRVRDLREDFGLMALKLKAANGTWHDVMQLRPRTRGGRNSAGPVIIRNGRRWLPYGSDIEVRPGGEVRVRGGFRSHGDFLGPEVTFRFLPSASGVRMSFPVRRGDDVEMTAFLSARSARVDGGRIEDARARYSLSSRPNSVTTRGGFVSCCNGPLVAAIVRGSVTRSRRMSWTVAAR